MESRLIVHIFRELRRKQLKLEKGKGGKLASVSVAQLKKSFPSLSTYEITSRLRDRCECQPLPVSSSLPRFLCHCVQHCMKHTFQQALSFIWVLLAFHRR